MNEIKKILKTYRKNKKNELRKLHCDIKTFINIFLPKYIANKIKNNLNINKCSIDIKTLSLFEGYLNNDYAISYIIKYIYSQYKIALEYNRDYETFEITINSCSKINNKIKKYLRKYNDNEQFIIDKIKFFVRKHIFDYFSINLENSIFSDYIEISYKDLDVNELIFKENIMFIRFYFEYKYKLKTYYLSNSKLQIQLVV